MKCDNYLCVDAGSGRTSAERRAFELAAEPVRFDPDEAAIIDPYFDQCSRIDDSDAFAFGAVGDGLTAAEPRPLYDNPPALAFKRAFDLVFSISMLLLLCPLYLLIAIAIKIDDSSGPVLFSSRDNGEPELRIGLNGLAFHYFKFRTMRHGTDSQRDSELAALDMTGEDSPLRKFRNDSRVTRVGAFLRKTHLDETIEFWHVLCGRMSVFGPRPHRDDEVFHPTRGYTERQLRVLRVKPGITGLAQVNGASDLPFDEEMRLCESYIDSWSPWLDIHIAIRTAVTVLTKIRSPKNYC
ncbi:sugar transferase [Patescibacteria group bacterium]